MVFGLIPALIAGAGLVSSAIGGSKQAGADAAAARAREAALNAFTSKQAAEFNRRTAAQQAAYDRINKLRNEGFTAITAQARNKLNETVGIKQRYLTPSTEAKLGTSARLGDILANREDLRRKSYLQLGDVTGAERERQKGYQTAGTAIANEAVSGVALPKFMENLSAATGRRAAPIISAVGTPGSGAAPNASGYTAQKAAEATQVQVGLARKAALAKSGASAYGDTISLGDRLLGRAGERVDILGRKAQSSREALDPEIAAARKIRETADENADVRMANAKADLSNYIKILEDAQAKELARTGQRQASTDELLNQFYSGAIQTENDFINALLNSSLTYEDALKQLMNFKISGTTGSSTAGKILSSAGGSLLSAGLSGILR